MWSILILGPSLASCTFTAKRHGKKGYYAWPFYQGGFQNSFIGSNLFAPLFEINIWLICIKRLTLLLRFVEYSKKLIAGYGVATPIIAVSNGIDLGKYQADPKKKKVLENIFGLGRSRLFVCAGLYFKKKGIEDFVEVAERIA